MFITGVSVTCVKLVILHWCTILVWILMKCFARPFPLSAFLSDGGRQIWARGQDQRDATAAWLCPGWLRLFLYNNYCWWCAVRLVLFSHQRRCSERIALRLSVFVSVNLLSNSRVSRVFWWSVIKMKNDLLMIIAMSLFRWEGFSSRLLLSFWFLLWGLRCSRGRELRPGQHTRLLFIHLSALYIQL